MADTDIMLEACNSFKKHVAAPDKKPETRRENFLQFRKDLLEGFRAGHISTADYSWDFYKMYEQIVPKEIRRDVSDPNASNDLIEHGMNAMTSTMFPELFGTAVTIGMLELTNRAPFNLSGYCGQERANCQQKDFYGFVDLQDIVDDSEAELEETQFYEFAGPTKLSQTKRSKKKFAHAMTREMLCVDGVELIRQMMRNGSEKLQRHRNKRLGQVLFGMYPYGVNPFPFIKDDTPWRSHYTGQNSGSPWINAMIGNKLDGSFRPFYFIEAMLDDQLDPYTNNPISYNYPDILVMDGMAADKARMGLGMVRVEWGLPGAPSGLAIRSSGNPSFDMADPTSNSKSGPYQSGQTPRLTQDRNSGINFSRILTDRYLRQTMRQWYQDVLKLSAADATEATHQTYAVGDLTSLRWMVEWPEETLERQGPSTWEYFNQEVLYSIKFMEKADPMWINPHGIIINWPDLSQFTTTSLEAAYNATTGTVAKITGLTNNATANKFWY